MGARFLSNLAAIFLGLACLLAVMNAVMRSVFGVGEIYLQELVLVFLGISFVCGSAECITRDSHVRITVFYEGYSQQLKTLLRGVCYSVCILPWVGVMLYAALYSPQSFVRLSFLFQESSNQAGGLQGVYLYKTLLVFLPLIYLVYGALSLKDKH